MQPIVHELRLRIEDQGIQSRIEEMEWDDNGKPIAWSDPFKVRQFIFLVNGPNMPSALEAAVAVDQELLTQSPGMLTAELSFHWLAILEPLLEALGVK